MKRIKVYNPIVVYSLLFLATHVLFGADLYLANAKLSFATIVFFVGLTIAVFVATFLLRRDLIWAECSVAKLSPSALVVAERIAAMGLVVKAVLVLYVLLVLGLKFSTLRRELGTVLPPSVILPIDVLVSVLFSVILADAVLSKGNVRRAVKMTVLYFSVFLLTGSRSFSLFFPFCLVAYLYFYGRIGMLGILTSLVVLLLVGGVVSVVRLLYADDFYVIKWYMDNDIFVESSLLSSAINVIVFQVRDMVIRTVEIINNVPEVMSFQHGKSLFFGFLTLLPDKIVNPAVEIHHTIFGISAGEDTPFPPTTVAQLYLDFNMFGVFIGGVMYAAISYKLFISAVKGTHPVHIAVLVSYLYFLCLSLYGDFEAFRFTVGLVMAHLFFRTRIFGPR